MAYLNFDGLDIKSLPKQVLKNSEDILSLATSGIATNNALGIHTIGIYEDTSYDNNTIYQNQSANNQPSDVITTPDLEPGDAYLNSEDTSIFWIYSDLVELNWQGWIGPISFKGLQGIQGIQGKTGEQGPRGYTGLTGTRGNKWFTGATTGTIANPLIGDLFLQTPTFMVYHYNSEQLWEPLSSIKGQDGLNGTDGETGPQGYTPYIQSGYWYINGVNTNIKAEGVDGASINIQSGVWTTGTLPLFENTEVGDAYVVTNDPTYQPALYFNGVGGSTWTISPWGVGTKGETGEDGEDGQDGVGVPSQGTAGQVLRKFSSDDYDTYWSDTDFGQLLKAGGTMTGKLTLNNNNVVNIFELINSLNTSYARLLFTSDSVQYSLGIGGSAAPISDLRNKFYIYDFTNSTPILYGNKDGLTIPGTLLVSGNMTCSGDILIPEAKVNSFINSLSYDDSDVERINAVGFSETERRKSKNVFGLPNINRTFNSNAVTLNNIKINLAYAGESASIVYDGTTLVWTRTGPGDALTPLTVLGLKPNTNYRMSFTVDSASNGHCFDIYYIDGSIGQRLGITKTSNASGEVYFNYAFWTSVGGGSFTLSNLQLEEGSTTTDYEPYEGYIVHKKEFLLKADADASNLTSGNVDSFALKLIDKIYPVGAIYMSVVNTSPASFIGGTWTALQDRFLLGAGSTYTAGNTGGSATHTITVDEMPTHNHGIYTTTVNMTAGNNILRGSSTLAGSTKYTDNAGSGSAHNNMPPYLVVYMWERTA